jgi:hypothetical protein
LIYCTLSNLPHHNYSNAIRQQLQILYATNNNLREIPESFSNLKKIGLLDLSRNQIETLHPLGKEVAPEQLYLDHNNITSLPANSDGIFCGTDDTETFSVTYNKLKKVPNIFSAKSKYVMKSVDFSYNEIDGFEGEEEGKYKGLRVETLSLAANPGLTKFPKCLGTTNSLVSYIILRGCSIDEIPEGSFGGKNSTARGWPPARRSPPAGPCICPPLRLRSRRSRCRRNPPIS